MQNTCTKMQQSHHASWNRSTWWVDVHCDVLCRICVGQVQHLCHQHLRHLIFHFSSQDNNAILQQFGHDIDLLSTASIHHWHPYWWNGSWWILPPRINLRLPPWWRWLVGLRLPRHTTPESQRQSHSYSAHSAQRRAGGAGSGASGTDGRPRQTGHLWQQRLNKAMAEREGTEASNTKGRPRSWCHGEKQNLITKTWIPGTGAKMMALQKANCTTLIKGITDGFCKSCLLRNVEKMRRHLSWIAFANKLAAL